MKTSLSSICVFTIFAILFCGCQTAPTPLSESFAENVGMSEERLGRIDAMLEEAIEQDQIPGTVALVARNGKNCVLQGL